MEKFHTYRLYPLFSRIIFAANFKTTSIELETLLPKLGVSLIKETQNSPFELQETDRETSQTRINNLTAEYGTYITS